MKEWKIKRKGDNVLFLQLAGKVICPLCQLEGWIYEKCRINIQTEKRTHRGWIIQHSNYKRCTIPSGMKLPCSMIIQEWLYEC